MNESKTHIAVIRLSAMGDVAMTVPILRAFVDQYPNIKITVISKGFLKPLFDDIKNVTFFTADTNGKHKGFWGLLKLFNELKALKITHVADLHDVLRSKILRSLFRFERCKVKHINKGRAEKKALTRIKNRAFKQLKTSHQRYADVFNELGFLVDISNPKPIQKPLLNNEILKFVNKNDQKKIGIAPFATHSSKTYPLDLMEEIIAKLDTLNYQLFLFGGKLDAKTLESIARKYKNTTSIAGKLGGFKNEIALISNLDLMLSMDSGNGHFSAMQGVKTITLWGGTHPFAGFAPFNQPQDFCLLPNLEKYPKLPCSIYGNKTCEGYEDAMRSIEPNLVVDKIISVLN